MSRFDRLILRAGEIVAYIGVLGLLLVAFFTVADVGGRYFFGKPLIGYVDIAGLGTALTVSTFFPLLLLRRANINLQLLGKVGGRLGHLLLEIFSATLTFGFFALMAWQYFRFASDATSSGEIMPIMRWPTAPWWWGVTLFISLAAVAGLAVLIQDLRSLGDKK